MRFDSVVKRTFIGVMIQNGKDGCAVCNMAMQKWKESSLFALLILMPSFIGG